MPSIDSDALDWVVQNRGSDPDKASQVMKKLGVDARDVDAWEYTKANPDAPQTTGIRNKLFDKLADAQRPVDETKGFPAIERIAIKNLADEGEPKVVSEYLQSRGFVTRIQDGKVQARRPEEQAFVNIEPGSVDKWDLTDYAKEAILDVTDVGRELLEAGIGYATAGAKIAGAGLAGPAGLAATAGASGALTAGVEAARQFLGQAVGVRGDVKPELIGEAAVLGAAIPGAIGAVGEGVRAVGTGIGRAAGRLAPFRLKPEAAQIQEAAETVGARVTPAQVVESPLVQKTEESLVKGGDLKVGRALLDLPTQVEANKKAVQKVADDIVSSRSFKETFDAGSEAGRTLTSELEAKIKPAADIYQKYETALQEIQPDTSELRLLLDELTNEFKFDEDVIRVLNQQKGKLDDIVSLDDLKKFRTSTGKILRDQKATRAAKQVYDTATEIRSQTLIDAAEDAGLAGAREEIERADAIYRDAANAIENAVTGRKPVKTSPRRTLKDFLKRTKEVDRVNKIIDTSDPVRIAQVKKDFPEVFEALRQQKVEEIAKKAEIKGEVSPTRLVKILDGLPQKTKIVLFGDRNTQAEQAMRTYLNSLPQPFNTSNTANMADFTSTLNVFNQVSSVGKALMLDIMVNTQLGQSLIQRAGAGIAQPAIRGTAVGLRGLIPEEQRERLRPQADRTGLTAPRTGAR